MESNIILQYIFAGLRVGSIYAIIAIGFNIIYNTTGIINFSQGEFVMLGGMIAYSFCKIMPLFFAVLTAVIITGIIGSLIEFIFIRHLKKPSVLQMIIITIGLSIIIREFALLIWGEQVKAVPFFTGNESSSINILGANISPQDLWVLGITCLIVIGLTIFFKYTLIGQSMRACSENRNAAGLCGINTRLMINLSFVLSASIGALAGCVVSPLTQTRYDIGTDLAIKGFTVAILGGLGNSSGAVAAGILLGLLEAFSVSVLPSAYQDVITLAILLIILFIRPQGIFRSSKLAGIKEF